VSTEAAYWLVLVGSLAVIAYAVRLLWERISKP